MNPLPLLIGAGAAAALLWFSQKKPAESEAAPDKKEPDKRGPDFDPYIKPQPERLTDCKPIELDARARVAAAVKAASDAMKAPTDPALYQKIHAANVEAQKAIEAYNATKCPRVSFPGLPVEVLGGYNAQRSADILQAYGNATRREVMAFDPRGLEGFGGGGGQPSTQQTQSQTPLGLARRPESVPRMGPSEFYAAMKQNSLVSSGTGQPDLRLGTGQVWPMSSSGAFAGLQSCDPVCSSETGQIVGRANGWFARLATLAAPQMLSPADVANLLREIGDEEKYLMSVGAGYFARNLAAVFAIFVGAIPELTDELEKGFANHVILATKKTLEAMGVNPAKIPHWPLVVVPRDVNNNQRLVVPLNSWLNIFPGVK